MSFVHLHVHSSFSLLDGAQTPKQIVKRIQEIGQNTVAITDHGNLHGLIKFWDACKKENIKPILGIEAYIAFDSRLHKEPIENTPPAFHITLLVKNQIGLKNLYKLSSLAYLEGFYHKPRIDYELLQQYHNGLICLSGCISGKIQWFLNCAAQATSPEQAELFYQAAKTETRKIQTIFNENFYMEFQRIIPVQEIIIPLQDKICKELGIQGVATCDAHYARPEDAEFHEQILCLSTNKKIQDEKRMGKLEGLYLKTEKEMQELWKDYPQVVTNTQIIADQCQLDQQDIYGKANYIFPTFSNNDIDEFETKCWEGLKKRQLDTQTQYRERLEYEIQTIKDMDFPSYFLVVSDYVCWAKEQGIIVGPGRGSAAGSLVAYVLKITDIDPLIYSLLFQRFLNKGRKSMPDIDIDFCMHRRGEVFDYIVNKYGRDKVSQITTFSEFKPRGACRDFARVQGEPYTLGEQASKLVPPASRGREPTWEITLSKAPELLSSRFNNIINMATKSEGLNKGRGIHAGGLVISQKSFEEVAPRCLGVGKNKAVTSQWDMHDLERIGLVKMDILGLTSLTLIDKILDLIVETNKITKPHISQVPLDDKKAFDLIARGETSGLFQLDGGGGIRMLCMQLQPKSISEIAAISALFRPGPLDSGVVEEYVNRATGKKPVEYLVPELEPILNTTYGLLIYQEQAMRIATDLAGYNLEGADDLRKAIGKKLPEKMAKEEEKLLSGMMKKNISSDTAKEIWEMIKVFADYGFNASHAVAYSYITYYTAYLKANYPVEFYCALLTLHYDNREKLMEYLGDCRNVDIQVQSPDINESNIGFTIHNGIIRFGLMAITNIGEKLAKQIVLKRQEALFTDIFDFYQRVEKLGINKRTIETLAKAGALTSLGAPRSGILSIVEELINHKKEVEKYNKKMITYNKRIRLYQDREDERKDLIAQEKKPKPSLTKPQPPEYPPAVVMPDIEELDLDELLVLEKEMLGLYITSHPLYNYELDILHQTNAHTGSLDDHCDGEYLSMIGIISQVKDFITRAGQKMAVIDLEDLHGHIEVTIFNRLYDKIQSILQEGNIILLKSKLEASNENIKKLIALEVQLLPNKKAKKIIIEPKQIDIRIPDTSLITVDHLDIINKIIILCPGKIETNIYLQLEGFEYKLDKTSSISFEGVKQLTKRPELIINYNHK